MVALQLGDEIKKASEIGNGPVNAAMRAVDRILAEQLDLEEYLVQSNINRSFDTAKVHVRLCHKNKSYVGFGVDTDIVTASVQGYLNAINKISSITDKYVLEEEPVAVSV